MNDNENNAKGFHAPKMVLVGCECIVRITEGEDKGKLAFCGQAGNPFAKCVDRVNAGTASEVDLLCLSTLPVFDENVADEEPTLIFTEKRR